MTEIPTPPQTEGSALDIAEHVADQSTFSAPEGRPVIRSYMNAEGVPLGTTDLLLSEIDSKVANKDFKSWRSLIATTKDAIRHEGKLSGKKPAEIKKQVTEFNDRANVLRYGLQDDSELVESSSGDEDVVNEAAVIASGQLLPEGIAEKDYSVESGTDDLGIGEPLIEDIDVEPSELTDQTQENVVLEKTPAELEHELLVEAFQTPDTLMQALASPEFPAKAQILQMVEALREVHTASEVNQIWQNEIVPLIDRLAQGGLDSMRYEITHITGMLEEKASAMRNFGNAIYDRYPPDDLQMFARRLGLGELAEATLPRGRYRAKLAQHASELVRTSGTISATEQERSETHRRLLNDHARPVELSELREIYAQYGTELQEGLTDATARIRSRLSTRAESESPNWRARSDNIEQLDQARSRLRSNALLNEGTTPEERRLIGEIEEMQTMARRGVMGNNNLAEMMGDCSRRLRSLIDGFEEVRMSMSIFEQIAHELRRA